MVQQYKVTNIRSIRRNSIAWIARVIDEDQKKKTMYAVYVITYIIVVLYILCQFNLIRAFPMAFATSIPSDVNNKLPNILTTIGDSNLKSFENGVPVNTNVRYNYTDVCQPYTYLENTCIVDVNVKSNTHGILQQLDDWVEMIEKSEITPLGARNASISNYINAAPWHDLSPILSISACNSPDSIWKYKYAGSKGRKRIFHGKGKLSFTLNNSPPHGYDYGMKSGHCLKMLPEYKESIESIEGFFDEHGVLEGHNVRIKYRNGRLFKATMVKGIIHGLVLEHDVKIDPETNRPSKDSPVLSKVCLYNNGEENNHGYAWHLLQNEIRILRNNDDSNKSLIFLPKSMIKDKTLKSAEDKSVVDNVSDDDGNGHADVICGKLDIKDQIVVNAKIVQLVSAKLENELMLIDVKEAGLNMSPNNTSNNFNDYDLQTKSWTNAVTAKLFRFIDLITDSEEPLADHFQPMSNPHLHNERQSILEFTGKSFLGDDSFFMYFDITCPYDRNKHIKAKFRKKELDSEGRISGNFELKMVTDWRRKDINAVTASQKNESTSSSTTNIESDNGDINTVQREPIIQEVHDDVWENEFLTYQELPFKQPSDDVVESIAAMFYNGTIQDGTVASIKFTDYSIIEGFVQNNSFHGIVRYLDPPLAPDKHFKRYAKNSQVQQVRQVSGFSQDKPNVEVSRLALHRNGYPDGPSWEFLTGALLYTNSTREKGKLMNIGAHMDNKLDVAYVGRFEDKKLISGHLAKVIGQSEVEQIRIPQFSDPISDTKYQSIDQSYMNKSFLVSNHLSKSPLLITDPTEDHWVYVNKSQTLKHMSSKNEDGLFAKRNIPEHQVVAFYGGFRFSKSSWDDMRVFDPLYFRPVYMEPGK